MQAVHEKIPLSERHSFQSFTHTQSEFLFNWHFHPEYELTLITRGHGRRYIGDSIEEYTEGDLVMVGNSLPHTWQSDSLQKKDQQAVVIQFPHALFQIGDDLLKEFSNIMKLLHQSARGLHITASQSLLDKIRELPNAQNLSRLMGLYEILDEIQTKAGIRILASENFNPSLADEDKRRFDKIHHFLQTNIEENITLEQVAKAHHMTKPTFNRFFKRNTGKTLIEYVNCLRIGNACALLIETNAAVTEIAYQTGYSNLSHFNRMFLRLRKMKPSEYRKHYRLTSDD